MYSTYTYIMSHLLLAYPSSWASLSECVPRKATVRRRSSCSH